mmetsp:Transcript_23530/g.64902  ORF Transcript_23530/g.64902 Transcript_23530/m.64902 type:complete len:211 (-) Transcript_23530:87-719(-)
MSVAEPTAPAHLPSNATGVAADARGHRPSLAESTTSMWAKPRQAMHQVHLPPLASGTSTFHAVLAESNEDEGIRYVENLRVEGGVLGTMLKADGDFVGTPQLQWYRQSADSKSESPGRLTFTRIEAANSLEYCPTADDVGFSLRLEAVGPYGGTPVVVTTSPIALDTSTHGDLEAMLRKGHAEFTAQTPQQVGPFSAYFRLMLQVGCAWL